MDELDPLGEEVDPSSSMSPTPRAQPPAQTTQRQVEADSQGVSTTTLPVPEVVDVCYCCRVVQL